MKCNVGKRDRCIFLFIGILICAAGLFFHSWWGLVGLIPVIVASTGRCALFYLFKVDTTQKKPVS